MATFFSYGQETSLNGIWGRSQEGIRQEWRFNNGVFESFQDGVLQYQGNYTTNNNVLTMNFTHMFVGPNFQGGALGRFESRLYSQNELAQAIISRNPRLDRSGVIEMVDRWFPTWLLSYSINGNSLSLTFMPNGETGVFIKQ